MSTANRSGNPSDKGLFGKRASLRSCLGLWMIAIAVLAVAAILTGGQLMHRASLDDQRQALAEHLRVSFQSQRALLDARALWLAAALDREGAITGRNGSKLSAAQLTDRLQALAAMAGGWNAPKQLTLVDRHGQVVATWPGGDRAKTGIPCGTVRNLVGHWRPGHARRVAAGICARNTHADYVVLAPLRTSRAEVFLEVSTDLRQSLRGLEQNLQMPLQLSGGDGLMIYRSSQQAADPERTLRAEFPLVADTGNKSLLVLSASRPAGAGMLALAEARFLALLIALVTVIVLAALLYWYFDRAVVRPLSALGVRLRDGQDNGTNKADTSRYTAEMAAVVEGVDRLGHQLNHQQQALEQATSIDTTTQLPNRSAFLAMLDRSIRHRSEQDAVHQLAILVLDLDGFKDINDTLGLPVGNALLQQVGERLRSKLREMDTVARIGGDEFAMLLPQADARQATTAARLLMQALHLPFLIDGQTLDISACIGIALYPDHGMDSYVLIQHANVALQSARQGINRYCLYEETLDEHSADRLVLIGELRRAIEQEQFELYYQPKVDLASRRVTGVEALTRWRHPREGLLLPERFIPLLEQTGLIRGLTPWLTNEAMRFARRLQDLGHPLTVSINLSMRDLQDPHLADSLAELLAAHRIGPSLIELEITESAVMDEPERGRLVLERLSGMGFGLAIDDFGTGYSSFTYLKHLPVNTLKIDKSFVLNMLSDRHDAAIVRTSIELAHHFGLQIVAEGVENVELLDSLHRLACDSAQGYYLSRPLRDDELVDWLRQSNWGLSPAGKRISVA